MSSDDDAREDTSEKYVALDTTMADLRRDDGQWRPLPREQQAFLSRRLSECSPIFRKWPAFASDKETAEAFAMRFLAQREGYSWTLDFSGDLFCELAYEGFLSTSLELSMADSAPLQVMLPWNDPTRNTLDWSELHVSKNARKRAKRYTMTVDAAYDEVMLQCIRMHGEGWLYRGLRWLLRRLFSSGYQGQLGIQVGVHSFELWDSEGRLVAGDLGYAVGAIYTSMTGFRLQDTQGAGEVQLVLTAALLKKMGYAWWDLGMTMKYKGKLGARVVSRGEFVERLKGDRDTRVNFAHERIGGGELMAWLLSPKTAEPGWELC